MMDFFNISYCNISNWFNICWSNYCNRQYVSRTSRQSCRQDSLILSCNENIFFVFLFQFLEHYVTMVRLLQNL